MGQNIIKFPVKNKRISTMALGGISRADMFIAMPDRTMVWEDKRQLVKKLVNQH